MSRTEISEAPTIHTSRFVQRTVAWIPLLVLPALALTLKLSLPPWAFMWLLAGAIFLGCKWQTLWDALLEGQRTRPAISAAYLFAWPGMDADAFLDSRREVTAPGVQDWLWAIGKTLLGAALFWGAARIAVQASPLVAGWLGMIGLIFLLHFGSFHLLALLWQSAGVDAQPIMQSPHRAESLSEFWGARWNLGFRRLTHDLVFAPLRKHVGMTGGMLGAFLVSGLIHDLVISLPAGAGYGLPTSYFLVQGLAVMTERSRIGKRLGLGRGLSGRLFLVAISTFPVPMLFHRPFVENVILPFMRAAGAL